MKVRERLRNCSKTYEAINKMKYDSELNLLGQLEKLEWSQDCQ